MRSTPSLSYSLASHGPCIRVLGVPGTGNVQCPACAHRWDPLQVPAGAKALLCPRCAGNVYSRDAEPTPDALADAASLSNPAA